MPNYFQDDFSKLEYDGWSRAAEWYDQSWANLTRQFTTPLLHAAGIAPQMKVLDLACGPGYVTQQLYLEKCLPIGIDFSGQMIERARQSFPHLEFREGDAQKLQLANESFDRVVMNFGMLHLVKPQLAISEAYRILKRKGVFAFTVWAGPDKSPTAKVMFDSVTMFADPDKKLPPAPDSYLFSDEKMCRQMLAENGFTPDSFQFRYHQVRWTVPTAGYLFETEMKAGVRTAALLKLQSQEALEKIKMSVMEGMKTFYNGKEYDLQFCGCIISVQKP